MAVGGGCEEFLAGVLKVDEVLVGGTSRESGRAFAGGVFDVVVGRVEAYELILVGYHKFHSCADVIVPFAKYTTFRRL